MNEISRFVPITKAKNDLLELIRRVEDDIDESVDKRHVRARADADVSVGERGSLGEARVN